MSDGNMMLLNYFRTFSRSNQTMLQINANCPLRNKDKLANNWFFSRGWKGKGCVSHLSVSSSSTTWSLPSYPHNEWHTRALNPSCPICVLNFRNMPTIERRWAFLHPDRVPLASPSSAPFQILRAGGSYSTHACLLCCYPSGIFLHQSILEVKRWKIDFVENQNQDPMPGKWNF